MDKNERQPGLEPGEGRTIMSKSFINNSTDRSGRSDRQAKSDVNFKGALG